MSLETILAALDRHAAMFDLSGTLGSDLLDTAVDGCRASFDAQTTRTGDPWPELTTDYAEWKARHFPGQPMGRLTDEMAGGFPGARQMSPDEARWDFGETAMQQVKVQWFSTRRPFVGLTEDAKQRSTEVLRNHLKENV